MREFDRVIWQAPTGFGKTTLGMMLGEGVLAKGTRAIFVTHRREIFDQVCKAFSDFGVTCGLIAAGFTERPERQIQIAMVESLRRRIARVKVPDLLILDECHHGVSNQWSEVIAAFPRAKVVGLTATPIRTSGAGLGKWFQHIVLGPSVAWLIDQGYLSDFRCFGFPSPDLKGVHTVGGEYSRPEVAELMDKPVITGDVLREYQTHCAGKRAIGFAVSIKHSQALAQAFVDAGIPAAHVDGETPAPMRAYLMAGFRQGNIKVLWNVGLFGEGVDVPGVEAILDVSPTKSLTAYLQRFGRALRPLYEQGMPLESQADRLNAIAVAGKVALYLDHGGNCVRFGFPDDERAWSLESGIKRGTTKSTVGMRQCVKCYCCHRPAAACPACGNVYPVTPREVAKRAGKLTELERDQVAKKMRAEEWGATTRDALIALGRARGYKNPESWAHFKMQGRQAKASKKKRVA